MKSLPFYIHLRLFIKSFFVQALWNYKSMLSLGMTYILTSLNKNSKLNKKELDEFYENNARYFNSHPYFAAYFIGFVARLWTEQSEQALQKINKMRNYMIGPLGAIGDELFWHDIKPSTMILAVLGALLQYFGYPGWIIMILSFIFYNIPHFYIRWHGITIGFRAGMSIYSKLHFDSFKKIFKLYKFIGILSWILGIGCVLFFAYQELTLPLGAIIFLVVFMAMVFEHFHTNNIAVIIIVIVISWILLAIFEG